MVLTQRIFLFIIFSIALLGVYGQENIAPRPPTNLRSVTVSIKPDSFVLDTVSIVPHSFSIKGVDSADYKLDYINAVLYWIKKPATDSVQVSYRVFPMKLNKKTTGMNFDSLVLFSGSSIASQVINTSTQRDIFNFGNINAQGSFGREIGFGNNQSAVVNSNLNVQLSGMLADSIELQAAISDNNIPIQPDGNTQQLNEFDQVYIRFKKKNWQLNIGDIDIRENESYFLNFYKRLQGLAFETTNKISKNSLSKTVVSGSIAKGKFTRNVFNGLEGNQGPYRLNGANNETFFIVLANTERVFIDGQLLQRGEDQDYVINYNTAEITFTPRRMITKDTRIQIEFEYADRNFLNTNLFATQQVDINKKLKINFGFFQNSDSKNSSINQVLDSKQKQFLSEIGDSIQKAFYPSAILDSFAAGKILYEKVYDSLDNVVDSFYRYSTDPLKAKYNLGFTEVGFGRGNYIPDNGNANGKVFKYVPPVNGVKQGNFEPVTILISPKKQQLMNLGIDYQLSKNTLLKTEFASSNYDVNTFSKINNGDDKGFAAKVNLSNAKQVKSKNDLKLLSSVDYEYVQNKFQPLERLRNVEFTRDWGLPVVAEKATEHFIKASVGLKNNIGNLVQYDFVSYNRSDHYKGFQNALKQITNRKNWLFNNEAVITHFKTETHKGYFLRPIIDISKKFPKLANWRIGGRYTLEENNTRSVITDTLNPLAFSYDTYTVFVKSDEAKMNKYGLSFYSRKDKYPVGKNFKTGDKSYNLNLQTEILSNSKRQFYLNTTFRKLKVIDQQISRQKDDNTILGRAEYMMNEWNGFLTGNILYEAGSGQEQKREYAYLEVPAGTGQYTWIDYNEDGVQQLNEFELAAFKDQAKFIRILTPTNEYIKANYTTFNYSINLTPKQLFLKKDKANKDHFLSKFILTSSLQISKKALARGSFGFNPFSHALNDTNLITLSTTFVNTISFNRQSTVWGLDFSSIANNNKALLTYGYESRKNTDWLLKSRIGVGKTSTFNLNLLTGTNALNTDNNKFENKNYEIRKNSIESSFSYVGGSTFRLTGGYKFEKKKNVPLYGGEKLTAHSLLAESKYNILQSAALTGKFTYQSLNYKSSKTGQSTVSYIMMDGLMPGNNFLWNLMLTKRILNNLELNLIYDGRKSGKSKTIHTGSASITAIF